MVGEIIAVVIGIVIVGVIYFKIKQSQRNY